MSLRRQLGLTSRARDERALEAEVTRLRGALLDLGVGRTADAGLLDLGTCSRSELQAKVVALKSALARHQAKPVEKYNLARDAGGVLARLEEIGESCAEHAQEVLEKVELVSSMLHSLDPEALADLDERFGRVCLVQGQDPVVRRYALAAELDHAGRTSNPAVAALFEESRPAHLDDLVLLKRSRGVKSSSPVLEVAPGLWLSTMTMVTRAQPEWARSVTEAVSLRGVSAEELETLLVLAREGSSLVEARTSALALSS